MSRYIDADALKRKIETMYREPDIQENLPYNLAIAEVLEVIDEFPSANVVEVVHGEWIDKRHDDIYECSKCGDMWMGIGGYNYCPNCGAKIERREDAN